MTHELPTASRQRDRMILALAVPALGTLLAEPLFLIADTAIVGRLGTTELAGLALGATVMATVIGLCIFLAYGTTATTARHLGAGREREAMDAGIDGLWLALLLGAVVSVLVAACAPVVVHLLGGQGRVAEAAVAYIRASAPGIVFMLMALAATGVLRGLLDTRTPLVTTVAGAAANVALNWVLVHPIGLGIGGSGLGTSIAQAGMGTALTLVVVRHARRRQAGLTLRPRGVWQSARAGLALVVRSVAMRVTHLVTTMIATRQGAAPLAAHQVVLTLWTFTAFALDAIAIAGQALVGRALGSGDHGDLRAVVRRMVVWGLGFGAVLGVGLLALSPAVHLIFDTDAGVTRLAHWALAPAALAMPLAGLVFVLDGILIGAGDNRYLGRVAVLNTLTYLPMALAAWALAPPGAWALVWLWVALSWGWMGSRAFVLGRRIRRADWLMAPG